ncbi:MAG: metallophosphoesterase [Phycisphaerae bacterium]|nr:metallophosphoesterase [Phycisphaerae bacterium]
MNRCDYSRRDILKICSLTAAASAVAPAVCSRAAEVRKTAELKEPLFRFAVASDIHFGQAKTPFAKTTENLILWLNDEKKKKGLDAIFLNGDLVHDSAADYDTLKSKYLSRLKTPYYTTKGNHDFIDEKASSSAQAWKKIWGYETNHVVKIGKLAFILADTSAPRHGSPYLAADIDWLKKQIDALDRAEAIFVFMHIAQRKRGVQGWPKWGLKDKKQIIAGEKVMAFLELQKKVRAIFHGHDHNSTSRLVSGGKPYFFDSHIGGSFGNRKGYRIVEIHAGDKMRTYQVEGENGKVMNTHAL